MICFTIRSVRSTIMFSIPILIITALVLIGGTDPIIPMTEANHKAAMMWILIAAAFYGYFFPTFLAYTRGAYHKLGIFLVNLGLGYTGIGYLFALLWAIYDDKGKHKVL